jgi:hypothetical protein
LRVRRYGSPFPGLVTALPDGSACFQVANAGRVHLHGVKIEGFDHCVRLLNDASLILEKLRYRPAHMQKSINVNLAYAISFGEKIRPENVHEYMEDLFIYHINNYNQLRQSANDEKRRLSASG